MAGHVHSVYLDPATVTRTLDHASMGHRFTVVVDVTDAAECQLRWYERTNIPYHPEVTTVLLGRAMISQEGQRPNEWTNMYALASNSDIFDSWNAAKAVGGRQTVRITDIPGITLVGSKERRLDFRIIVEGSDGSEVAATACQELTCVDGEATSSRFLIYTNNAPTTAGGWVGKNAPLHPSRANTAYAEDV